MVPTDSLFAVGALLLLAGLALNPALTTFSLLVDHHAPAPTAAEAFGWLSTAIAAGTGGGAAIAAAAAQHQHDARAVFIIAVLAAGVATATAGASRRTLGSR